MSELSRVASAQPPCPSPRRLYVGGRWIDGSGETELVVLDPATEDELARVAEGTSADVDAAVLAARRAF
ncbi:MAG: aldehyde dehydrogenase family protein, partial [Candidatus Binatia bacterium]